MPRKSQLTAEEKTKIVTLHEAGKGDGFIAEKLGRHRETIRNVITKRHEYGNKKRSGRPRKMTKRDERRIARAASNQVKSLAQIKAECNLDVSKSTLCRVLQRNPSIDHKKMAMAPKLKSSHKAARLEFARRNMVRKWKLVRLPISDELGKSHPFFIQVIFSDEKKFNFDGPDGFKSYWRDLRKEAKFFSKRNFGGGSVMVWAAFSAKGKSEIAFVSNKMNSAASIKVLQDHLVPFWDTIEEPGLVFMQDNAPIHSSRETRRGLQDHNITLLDWPACSPDQNPIENCWGIVVRNVYANNRQFTSATELKAAIQEAWRKIDERTILNLVESMHSRLFQLIQRAGGVTDY